MGDIDSERLGHALALEMRRRGALECQRVFGGKCERQGEKRKTKRQPSFGHLRVSYQSSLLYLFAFWIDRMICGVGVGASVPLAPTFLLQNSFVGVAGCRQRGE